MITPKLRWGSYNVTVMSSNNYIGTLVSSHSLCRYCTLDKYDFVPFVRSTEVQEELSVNDLQARYYHMCYIIIYLHCDLLSVTCSHV